MKLSWLESDIAGPHSESIMNLSNFMTNVTRQGGL